MTTTIFKTFRPTMLINVPTAMMQMATMAVCQRPAFADAEDLQQESARRIRQRAEGQGKTPHVRPRGGPAPGGAADVARPLVDAARVWPSARQLAEYGRDEQLPDKHDRECPEEFGPAANSPRVKIAYTAAIGDTSANANDSADRKLKPRIS